MKSIFLILAFVALASGAVKPNGNVTLDDLDDLQGTWNFVALEVDGAKIPEPMLNGSRIIIKGHALKQSAEG